MQVSPDRVTFIDESAKISTSLHQLKFIVPYILAKFTRVAVKNNNSLETLRVKIWFKLKRRSNLNAFMDNTYRALV